MHVEALGVVLAHTPPAPQQASQSQQQDFRKHCRGIPLTHERTCLFMPALHREAQNKPHIGCSGGLAALGRCCSCGSSDGNDLAQLHRVCCSRASTFVLCSTRDTSEEVVQDPLGMFVLMHRARQGMAGQATTSLST